MRQMMCAMIAAMVAMAASAASAETITFDPLAFDGGPGTPAAGYDTVTVGDYLFTGVSGGTVIKDFAVYARGDTRNADPGGAALGLTEINLTYTLTRVDGGAFDIGSLDLTQLNNDASGPGYSGVVAFFLDGGPAIFHTFDGTPGYQSVTIGGTGIHSLGIRTDNFLAIDNLQLAGGAAPLPEPASWAMLVAGFGMLGAALRRHSAAVATAARM